MSRLKALVLVAAVLSLLAPAMALAQGIQLPCRFHGTVRLDGERVRDGVEVALIIEGDIYTTTTPAEVYGNSTYALRIDPPPGKFYDDGTPITFAIANNTANQTATWESGGNKVLDLTAFRVAPTPSPTATPFIVPTPTPVATPTPGASPTPAPTAPPTAAPTAAPSPTAPPPASSMSTTRLIGLIVFGILLVLVIAVLVYVVWKMLQARRAASQSQAPPQPPPDSPPPPEGQAP